MFSTHNPSQQNPFVQKTHSQGQQPNLGNPVFGDSRFSNRYNNNNNTTNSNAKSPTRILVDYIAQNNALEVARYLKSKGYATENLPKSLLQIMAEQGEEAVHEVAQLHPDYELIAEEVAEKNTNKIDLEIQKHIAISHECKTETVLLKEKIRELERNIGYNNMPQYKNCDGGIGRNTKTEPADLMPYIVMMFFGIIIYKLIN